MTSDNMKKLKRLLEQSVGKEITESKLQEQLKLAFKEAKYLIDKLTNQGILNSNGLVVGNNVAVRNLTITDDNAIKNLDLFDDVCAIIKRDGKYDEHAIEEELNVSSNMLFDLDGELLNKGIIERVDSEYRLKV